IVTDDDAGMASLQKKHAQETAWGIKTEILDREDVLRLLPHLTPEIRGATFSRYEGFCETAVLAAAVRQALGRAGVEIRADAALVEATAGEIFRLKLADRTVIESPVLVGCLGAFMDDLLAMLGLPSGLMRLPLQIHAMDAPRGVVPVFTRYAGGRLSLKQYPLGRVIVGGGWPAERHPDDPMAVLMSTESRRGNTELAGRIIPALARLRCTEWRGGWAAWTRDGLPAIGGYASLPYFYTAFGSNGFTLAPLYAELLVSLVQGERPLIGLDAFSPDRFRVDSVEKELPPDG
ncbi:MAG TPA: FAD-binding oxidoreductase, partial [Candidatus Nanopelagicales bacterium]|nr:FAD-binding oxidoreductase [Candidatus Nanopelagicales bacterium]